MAPVVSDYLRTINQTFYDQVRMADQKAAYVFTFLVAMLIFWSSDIRRGVTAAASPEMLSHRWLLTMGFTLALCFTTISATLVILPRKRPSSASLFWGAWPAAGEALRALPDDQAAEYIRHDYIQNIQNLAQICRDKYRYVGFAHRGLITTILFHILSIAFG